MTLANEDLVHEYELALQQFNDEVDPIVLTQPVLNRGRIEFEKELAVVSETHTWQEVLKMMSDNEGKHHG